MIYTPLTAHARTILYVQCNSAGKRGGHVPLVPYAGSATGKRPGLKKLTVVIENDDFSIPGVESDIGVIGGERDCESLVLLQVIIISDGDPHTLQTGGAVKCQGWSTGGVVNIGT